VRKALSLATNKQEIIDKILSGNGYPVYAPITKGYAWSMMKISAKKISNLEKPIKF